MGKPGDFGVYGDSARKRVLDAVADGGRTTYAREETALKKARNAERRGNEDNL